MKTRALVSLLPLLFVFALIGCEEEDSVTGCGGQIGVVGSIHGVVTDANTNARIDSVLVTWIDDGTAKSIRTDDLGYYIITDLPSGKYEITFSDKNGYAVSRATCDIPTPAEIDTTEGVICCQNTYYVSEKLDADLYRLNADLTGIVYAQVDDETSSVASGVVVIADFRDYDLSPDEYTTTTDATGAFSFDNLPATPDVDWRTMPYTDGSHQYSGSSGTVSLVPGGTAKVCAVILDISTCAPFIVENNFENDDFALTDDIVLTFSKAMETSTFDVSLSSTTYGDVEFTSAWTNYITLTINPRVALQANETYSLSLTGKSQDGYSFSSVRTFETQEGIEFVFTNLERVDGVFDEFPVASDVEVTFSLAVDLGNYDGYVRLYDASDALVSQTTSLSLDSKTVIVDPLYDLEPGQEYTLSYKVYSTIEGDYDMDSIDFETASAAEPPAIVTGFALDQGVGWTANWNTTSIKFKWNTVTGADYYGIYAKDNRSNSDFVRVGSFTALDYVSSQSGTINLASYPQFDYFADDAIQTPFTGGTVLTFAVAARGVAGEGPFSDTLTVADETAPTGSLGAQSGTADNSAGVNPKVITVTFTGSEYLLSEAPTIFFAEAGGDPAFVLSGGAVVFAWDSNLRGGVLTITIPTGENGSGDNLYISFKDSSGNPTASAVSLNLF